MPTYPEKATYRAGFYNSRKVNGVDDRVYTAEDIRKPYDTVFSDGIMPDRDGAAGDTLKVSLVDGMTISVGAGSAKIGGAWFENTAAYNIILDAAGSVKRYDCIIIRNDDNEYVRAPSIHVKSLPAPPTVNDLERSEKVYEICVAYVEVSALVTTLLEGDIIDTRMDGSLCNVMSGVGAVVVRTYRSTYYSKANLQTGIPIRIPQFDRTRDRLTVIVEGRVFAEGRDYTVDGDQGITLAIPLPVIGTKIDFEVAKNVNAAAAETVVQEVAQLQNEMIAANRVLDHHYYCNGKTDNYNISELVSAFQNEATTYDSMRLVIHGHFGATSPRGGAGTAENPYYWFRSSQGAPSNRRVTLDFTDCEQIAINCDSGTYNIVFFGFDTRIIGANVIATGGAAVYIFSLAGGTTIHAENCRFWITTDGGGMVARSGTFINCRASVTNTTGHSYCFAPISASLLRVQGGEYYAYTGSAEHVSAIVGVTSGENAVAILYGVNAPTSARGGYNQTHSVYQTTGIISCTDIISALPLNVVSGLSNIRGTIALSKAGLM